MIFTFSRERKSDCNLSGRRFVLTHAGSHKTDQFLINTALYRATCEMLQFFFFSSCKTLYLRDITQSCGILPLSVITPSHSDIYRYQIAKLNRGFIVTDACETAKLRSILGWRSPTRWIFCDADYRCTDIVLWVISCFEVASMIVRRSRGDRPDPTRVIAPTSMLCCSFALSSSLSLTRLATKRYSPYSFFLSRSLLFYPPCQSITRLSMSIFNTGYILRHKEYIQLERSELYGKKNTIKQRRWEIARNSWLNRKSIWMMKMREKNITELVGFLSLGMIFGAQQTAESTRQD